MIQTLVILNLSPGSWFLFLLSETVKCDWLIFHQKGWKTRGAGWWVVCLQLYGAVVCMEPAGRLIVRVSGPAEPPIVFGIVHWYFSSCIYGVLVDAFGMV